MSENNPNHSGSDESESSRENYQQREGGHRQGRQGGHSQNRQPQGRRAEGGQPRDEQPRGRRQQGGQSQGGQRRQRRNQQPQQRQGGQSQRRQQPQQGRQPQQRRQSPPQGQSPPPQRGGGGDDDGIDTSTITNLAVWIAVAMAAAGLAFGLMPLAYGSFGSGDVTETVPLDERGEPIDQGEPEPDRDLSPEEQAQQNEQDEREQKQFQNEIIEFITIFSPFLVVLLGGAAGLTAGIFGSVSREELAAGVGVGVLAGVVLFMLLSNAVATFQWQTMLDPEYVSAIDSDLSLSYGTLIINSIAIGITTAICAALAAVGGDEFTD